MKQVRRTIRKLKRKRIEGWILSFLFIFVLISISFVLLSDNGPRYTAGSSKTSNNNVKGFIQSDGTGYTIKAIDDRN